MFDDEIQKQIAEQARAAIQETAAMENMCRLLGSFRSGLMRHGFSQEGAEALALEFYCVSTDMAAGSDSE